MQEDDERFVKKDVSDNNGPQGVGRILHRLNSVESGSAWAEFIDRYSPLIMKAVRQFEFEQERANDCFLHVCEKLCENGFRRLLQFNTEGLAQFDTWLGAVLFNLCVDWHRKEFGRAVMLPAIGALPAFDQAVYRLYFEQAMDREACRRTLEDEFPDLTAEQFAESIARVHRVLTPRQRWRIGARGRRHLRNAVRTVEVDAFPAGGAGPEAQASDEEQRRLLREAVSGLPADQRLLLRLRFEQGLTLGKIAEILGLGDPFRARRRIQAALDALSERLQPLGERRI